MTLALAYWPWIVVSVLWFVTVVVCVFLFFLFFFFKQKTAYEMRISDWSSDVCSSDLVAVDLDQGRERVVPLRGGVDHRPRLLDRIEHDGQVAAGIAQRLDPPELPRRDAHRVEDVAHARRGEVLGFAQCRHCGGAIAPGQQLPGHVHRLGRLQVRAQHDVERRQPVRQATDVGAHPRLVEDQGRRVDSAEVERCHGSTWPAPVATTYRLGTTAAMPRRTAPSRRRSTGPSSLLAIACPSFASRYAPARKSTGPGGQEVVLESMQGGACPTLRALASFFYSDR